MSMIKQLQQDLYEATQTGMLNEAEGNLRPGDLDSQLAAFAEKVDNLHADLRKILEANADQYEDMLNHGYQDLDKAIAKPIWRAEALVNEFRQGIADVEGADYGDQEKVWK